MKFRMKKFSPGWFSIPLFSGPNNPWSWIIRAKSKKMRIFLDFSFFLDLSHFIPNFILIYNIRGIFCIASPCDVTYSFNFLSTNQDWDQPRPQGQLSPAWAYLAIIGDLTKLLRQRYSNRNVEKSDRFSEQDKPLHLHHAFLYISLPLPHNHAKFTWERQQQGNKFYHVFLNAGAVPSLQLPPKFPTFK